MSWTNLKYKKVKIKKPRICFGCLEQYPAGAEMVYCFAVDGGDKSTTYCCPVCDQIANLEADWDDGIPEGFVRESLKKGQTKEEYLETLTGKTTTI